MILMTSAYTVTITHANSSVSQYITTQDAAYRRIRAEISHPAPGVISVEIRPAPPGK